MIIAADQGHVEVVELLVNMRGIILDQAANDGATALSCAIAQGHTAVVTILEVAIEARRNDALKQWMPRAMPRSPLGCPFSAGARPKPAATMQPELLSGRKKAMWMDDER